MYNRGQTELKAAGAPLSPTIHQRQTSTGLLSLLTRWTSNHNQHRQRKKQKKKEEKRMNQGTPRYAVQVIGSTLLLCGCQ